jgi:hypothetical protein
LLTTTTGCLRRRSKVAASGRPVRSAMPPGGKGLTMEMARVGYGSWAVTPETSVASVKMTQIR